MPTSIRLSADLETRLGALAARTGRTKAFYLREIIANGLTDLEEYYLAAQVIERVRAGTEDIVDLDQAERELGLDN